VKVGVIRSSMPPVPPPNDSLADLAATLGEDNVRALVQTFLRDFPRSIEQLQGGERSNRHRIAHGMKSNSRLMGNMTLSRRMAELEARLASATGQDVTLADITVIQQEFEEMAVPLRKFAEG